MSYENGFKPNQGQQERAFACNADILIFGGGAGGGKSVFLTGAPLIAKDDPEFRGIIFRRTLPEIKQGGGLFDEAKDLYLPQGATVRKGNSLDIKFPSGFSLEFKSMQREQDAEKFKGGQFTYIGFDELTEFEEYQFWFMVSRARSPKSQFEPWIRCTTNPKPGWVAKLLDWWIGEDGYPIPERDGVLRWFKRDDDGALVWFDEPQEGALSLTFIQAMLEDNPQLLKKDKKYKAILNSMDFVTRARLAKGNWKVDRTDGFFKHARINRGTAIFKSKIPKTAQCIRFWDLADTEKNQTNKNPDSTAGVLLHLWTDKEGEEHLAMESLVECQEEGSTKIKIIQDTASADTARVPIGMEQEPGSSGKEVARDYKLKHLAGYSFKAYPATNNKVIRAERWLSIAENGNFHIVLDETDPENPTMPEWFERLTLQLSRFPEKPRDGIDGISGGYAAMKKRETWLIDYDDDDDDVLDDEVLAWDHE